MISYSAYKVAHLAGVLLVMLSLGSLFVSNALGKEGAAWRAYSAALNGIGMILVLVAGFGLMARLGVGFEGWLLLKILIWMALGAMIFISNRKPESGKVLFWVAFALAALSAYFAHYKPF